jgi:PAS domain-containing protein
MNDLDKLKELTKQIIQTGQEKDNEEDVLLDWLESSSDGRFDFDVINNKVEWNAKLYSLFECPVQDLKLETYLDFVHPDDKGWVILEVQSCLSNNKDYDVTHKIITGNNNTKVIRVKGSFFKNGAKFIGIVWERV